MTSIMSEIPTSFDPENNELTNCFEFGGDFGGEFDYERAFNHEHVPSTIPSRLGQSSPNGSDESTDPAASAISSGQHNFPVLLHEIISSDEYDCIQWLPCGTFFAISDKEAFTKQVIPRFFDARGGTKFTSFTRRLKRWQFNRIASGTNIGAYYHECFRRGDPALAATIIYPAKATKSKNSPTTVVKSKVKSRRRASTGCIVEPVKAETDFGCTPIPVKPSVQLSSNPAVLELDSDMAELLASPDFVKDDEPIAQLQTDLPATPPFSSTAIEPAPVSDFSLANKNATNNKISWNQTTPTSVQSEKVNMKLAYQPKQMKPGLPVRSQSLFQNNQMEMMIQQQQQQMQPLAFPGALNTTQHQQQLFHPQMRRHSCMPMFSANGLDAASTFGVPMGVYTQPSFPPPTYTEFNPMLQVNNMRMNQNITGRSMSMNVKSSEFPEQKVGGGMAARAPQEVTSREVDQDDKWIDFDEYIARQDEN